MAERWIVTSYSHFGFPSVYEGTLRIYAPVVDRADYRLGSLVLPLSKLFSIDGRVSGLEIPNGNLNPRGLPDTPPPEIDDA